MDKFDVAIVLAVSLFMIPFTTRIRTLVARMLFFGARWALCASVVAAFVAAARETRAYAAARSAVAALILRRLS